MVKKAGAGAKTAELGWPQWESDATIYNKGSKYGRLVLPAAVWKPENKVI